MTSDHTFAAKNKNLFGEKTQAIDFEKNTFAKI